MTQTSANLSLSQERVARDERIVAARLAGEPWASIAAREGVSRKTAMRALRQYERAAPTRDVSLPEVLPDPSLIVAEVIGSELVVLREARRLVGEAPRDGARVAAMRTVLSAGTTLHLTMIRAGLVRTPGMEWFSTELATAARVLFDIAEEYGVPLDAVMARFEREVPRRGLPMGEIVEVAS